MRRFIRLTIFPLFVLFPLTDGIPAENQPWEELFFRANQAYRQGRFQEAIDGYLQLIRSGHGNGHLYYNAGNAYFRQDELGRAILYYERANLLIPRDADLKFNHRYALDQTRDAIAESYGFMSMTFFWLNVLNLNELFWTLALLNLLFWGALFVRLFLQLEWTYYFSLVLLVFWLIAGLSFGLKWYRVATDDRAVILQEEVNVLAGPDIRDTVLFKLHEGAIVNVERSEDEWSLVRLPDEKRGWLSVDAIERIRRQGKSRLEREKVDGQRKRS